MKTSEKGREIIKKHEGLKLEAYYCPANVLTIGYGHTGNDVKDGMKITKTQADEILQKDLERFEKAVRNAVTSKIDQYQFDALVSFSFNLGEGNLRKSTLLKKVNANPLDFTIKQEFLKWNKAGGKVLNGLTRRREEEADLYFSSIFKK